MKLLTHKVGKAKHYWQKEHNFDQTKDPRQWKVIKKKEYKIQRRKQMLKCIAMRDIREMYAIQRQRYIEKSYLSDRTALIGEGHDPMCCFGIQSPLRMTVAIRMTVAKRSTMVQMNQGTETGRKRCDGGSGGVGSMVAKDEYIRRPGSHHEKEQ